MEGWNDPIINLTRFVCRTFWYFRVVIALQVQSRDTWWMCERAGGFGHGWHGWIEGLQADLGDFHKSLRSIFSQGGSKCVAIFCGVLERKAVYNWHNSWRTPSKHLKWPVGSAQPLTVSRTAQWPGREQLLVRKILSAMINSRHFCRLQAV